MSRGFDDWGYEERRKARREGEHAQERGTASFSNPYNQFEQRQCHREWDDAYREARWREERREEEERQAKELERQRRADEERMYRERQEYEEEYMRRCQEEEEGLEESTDDDGV